MALTWCSNLGWCKTTYFYYSTLFSSFVRQDAWMDWFPWKTTYSTKHSNAENTLSLSEIGLFPLSIVEVILSDICLDCCVRKRLQDEICYLYVWYVVSFISTNSPGHTKAFWLRWVSSNWSGTLAFDSFHFGGKTLNEGEKKEREKI